MSNIAYSAIAAAQEALRKYLELEWSWTTVECRVPHSCGAISEALGVLSLLERGAATASMHTLGMQIEGSIDFTHEASTPVFFSRTHTRRDWRGWIDW